MAAPYCTNCGNARFFRFYETTGVAREIDPQTGEIVAARLESDEIGHDVTAECLVCGEHAYTVMGDRLTAPVESLSLDPTVADKHILPRTMDDVSLADLIDGDHDINIADGTDWSMNARRYSADGDEPVPIEGAGTKTIAVAFEETADDLTIAPSEASVGDFAEEAKRQLIERVGEVPNITVHPEATVSDVGVTDLELHVEDDETVAVEAVGRVPVRSEEDNR